MVISQLSSKNMLLQLCVGALRVAFERREPSNSSMERGHVLGPRQIMHFVENLQAFNFDLAQALIHRTHAGVVSEWVVVRRSSFARGWNRSEAVVLFIGTERRPPLKALSWQGCELARPLWNAQLRASQNMTDFGDAENRAFFNAARCAPIQRARFGWRCRACDKYGAGGPSPSPQPA